MDSGASNIRIVIFDELGNTIFSDKINEGANIALIVKIVQTDNKSLIRNFK